MRSNEKHDIFFYTGIILFFLLVGISCLSQVVKLSPSEARFVRIVQGALLAVIIILAAGSIFRSMTYSKHGAYGKRGKLAGRKHLRENRSEG